jgi:hypothetical protein
MNCSRQRFVRHLCRSSVDQSIRHCTVRQLGQRDGRGPVTKSLIFELILILLFFDKKKIMIIKNKNKIKIPNVKKKNASSNTKGS